VWFTLDAGQRQTLVWAGAAVVLVGFDGSVLTLVLPAIAHDFHARIADLSNLGSVLSLGSIGALPLATLADHFGRRRMIAIGVAVFSIANVVTAFVPSLAALAALRLVASCFEDLVLGVSTALIVEEAPRGRRGQAVSALALLFGAGQGIPVIAYPFVAPHWRWIFLAGGIGAIAAPLIWRMLPEGRAWKRARVGGSVIKLLLQAPWRRHITILAASAILGSILFTPAGLLFTVFATQTLHLSPAAISWMIVAAAVAAVAGYVVGGVLTDRYGRRILGALLGAITTILASAGFLAGAGGFVAANILWSGFASAGTPVGGAWSGELYPTRARATAEATGSVAGAVGGIVGLQIVGALSVSFGLGRAIAIAGVAGLAGAAILLLLPETKGKPLPD